MSELELVIGGTRYAGWKSVDVRRGLEQVADSFEVSLAERWSERSPMPIKPGSEAVVRIDGEPVLTGYVDEVLPSYDARSHTIAVSGRSKTADLVDCSGPDASYEAPMTVLDVARELAGPFGIGVSAEANVGEPLQNPAIEEGEPYAEAIVRLARHRALLVVPDVEGNLVLTQAPRRQISTQLVLGENILKASGRFSTRDRFSEVMVHGQGVASDSWSGEAASEPAGTAKDPGIDRYRPTLVGASTPVDSQACTERAEWEVRQRIGRSRGVTYTLNGWYHADGLWTPGDEVVIRDPWLGLDGASWIVAEVQLLRGSNGERAELRVVPASAYDLRATPEAEKEDSLW